MAATDGRPVPLKNTAYRVTFPVFDADGDLVSGLVSASPTMLALVSIDGAPFALSTNAVNEILSDAEGSPSVPSGMYFLDLTAAEMNGDTIALIVVPGSGKTTPVVLYPEEAGDIRVNLTEWRDAQPNVLISGRVDTNPGAIQNDVITAAAIAANAITAAKIATDAITAAKIAADAIGASELATDAVNEIRDAILADSTPFNGADIPAILLDTGATIPGLLALIQADTDDLQTRLPAALIGGRMDADVQAVNSSTLAAIRLALSTDTIVVGAAVAGTLSNTQMTTNLSEATDGHYIGRVIIWTSGDLIDQATDITGYAASGGLLTFTQTTEAPTAGDTFIIV